MEKTGLFITYTHAITNSFGKKQIQIIYKIVLLINQANGVKI